MRETEQRQVDLLRDLRLSSSDAIYIAATIETLAAGCDAAEKRLYEVCNACAKRPLSDSSKRCDSCEWLELTEALQKRR